MAAEAPDLHKGDLGRVEEVGNGPIGADTLATEIVLFKNYSIALLYVLGGGVGNIF